MTHLEDKLAEALRKIANAGTKFDAKGTHSNWVVETAKEALAAYDAAQVSQREGERKVDCQHRNLISDGIFTECQDCGVTIPPTEQTARVVVTDTDWRDLKFIKRVLESDHQTPQDRADAYWACRRILESFAATLAKPAAVDTEQQEAMARDEHAIALAGVVAHARNGYGLAADYADKFWAEAIARSEGAQHEAQKGEVK